MIMKEVPASSKPVLAKMKVPPGSNLLMIGKGIWYEIVFYDGTNWRPWDDRSNTFKSPIQILDWVYADACFLIKENIPTV